MASFCTCSNIAARIATAVLTCSSTLLAARLLLHVAFCSCMFGVAYVQLGYPWLKVLGSLPHMFLAHACAARQSCKHWCQRMFGAAPMPHIFAPACPSFIIHTLPHPPCPAVQWCCPSLAQEARIPRSAAPHPQDISRPACEGKEGRVAGGEGEQEGKAPQMHCSHGPNTM